MSTVIRAEGVTKHYGPVHALSELTVEITAGITGLLGANGAGKTTLLGLILGLHAPDTGRLEVLGADPATAGPRVRQRLGYGPEHDALPGSSRAQDLVRHVAELHGVPPRSALTRASETLDLVGLGEERLREIGTMSLGQRQRVKIAQAIAHDPDLVLLDEPTNGLDPLQREQMLATITRIGQQLGISVLLASHLVDEVERICDRVVVLEAGRLTRAGEVATLVSGDGEVLVEVDDAVAPLAEALAGAGVRAQPVSPTGALVAVDDERVLDLVRDTVVDLELGLRRLSARTGRLAERVFDLDAPLGGHE